MARAFWRLFFPVLYAFLRASDPFWRGVTERRGLVNTVELFVVGRLTGRERRVMLGLLAVGDRRYLGHANAAAAWPHDLAAAGEGRLVVDALAPMRVRAARVAPGDERDAVVDAASRQHPFPVDIAYRVARASIRHDGVFFRIEADDGTPIPLPARARRD